MERGYMSQSNKNPYSVRLDPELLDQVKSRADQDNETVTAIFEQALKSFLSGPNDNTNAPIDQGAINQLRARIERLESKLNQLDESDKRKDISFNKSDFQDKPPPKRPDPINPENVGELVTMEELEEVTGYSKSTLSSKFSRAGIQAVDRVDGNRAGLYSKKEVLDKIGIKGRS